MTMRARFALASAAASIILFFAIMLCLEGGREIGLMHGTHAAAQSGAGLGVIDGVISAVFALLLGFVFSGSTSRFDQRRQLIVQQVVAIRGAWQRVDSLSADAQPDVRNEFRRFIDALVGSYQRPATADPAASIAPAQEALWSRAVALCVAPEGERARMLLLPAMNDMFAAVERERLARRIHPPAIIYVMLVLGALVSALLGGYSTANPATHNWLIKLGAAAIVSLVLYVIVQIEYPRLGLVRVDAFDRALVELRSTMG